MRHLLLFFLYRNCFSLLFVRLNNQAFLIVIQFFLPLIRQLLQTTIRSRSLCVPYVVKAHIFLLISTSPFLFRRLALYVTDKILTFETLFGLCYTVFNTLFMAISQYVIK